MKIKYIIKGTYKRDADLCVYYKPMKGYLNTTKYLDEAHQYGARHSAVKGWTSIKNMTGAFNYDWTIERL